MRQRNLGRLIGVVYAFYFVTAIASVKAGITLEVASTMVYALLAILFYRLFAPSDRAMAGVALCVALAGCALQIYGFIVSLPVVQHVTLGFFAVFCLVLGYLIATTTYIPRIFGWLLIAAGIGWFAFLVPAVAARAGTELEVFGLLAEFVLMLWLLIRGVPEGAR